MVSSVQINQLDLLDKKILNEIQWYFPLTDRPFLEIANKHDITEEEIIQRIISLKNSGLIRQINAIFDTRRLGYKSALIAFAVESHRIDEVANEINKNPGVSHNYERNHEFNMWFTLAVPPDKQIKTILDKMASLKGVKKYRLLPTLKMYKIGVKLDMINDDGNKPKPTDKVKELNSTSIKITERDKQFIKELQKDIDIIKEPFKKEAKNLGISTQKLYSKAKEYEKLGIIRRFAAILRHRDAGFKANGMIVWKVPEAIIDDVGYKLASFPQVSHCYRRPTYPDWEFNLFSMIHTRSIEAAKEIAKEMSEIINIDNYRILFSSREFKKERVKYFEED
ncbi:MAG: Lrp/AsnC family transcriptional regulator [Nitrososphaeraceae archaeon]